MALSASRLRLSAATRNVGIVNRTGRAGDSQARGSDY